MYKMRYSIGPRDQIFIKGYRCLSFANNIEKNIGKTISKNLRGKYPTDTWRPEGTSPEGLLEVVTF